MQCIKLTSSAIMSTRLKRAHRSLCTTIIVNNVFPRCNRNLTWADCYYCLRSWSDLSSPSVLYETDGQIKGSACCAMANLKEIRDSRNCQHVYCATLSIGVDFKSVKTNSQRCKFGIFLMCIIEDKS